MSLKQIFSLAVNKAQQENFCHKKLMKSVENAFDKSKLEEFLQSFIGALYGCYNADECADKSSYVARCLQFLAKIAIKITLKCVQPVEITDANGTVSQVYDITLDPFFINVLKSSLKFAHVTKSEVRFNTCYFITTLLQNIGNNVEMDYSVCNIILDSLVELLHDAKANVRTQAIKALVKLQEPSNAECIVLKSFLILITDPNSEVRREVINHIAPHPQSFAQLRMRLRDSVIAVRQAAYTKFADINPKLYLNIINRNIILTCALADTNKKIKHIFTEKLLPKWLSHFEGNFLLFFRALRLDADENDISNFEKLCTELLDIFLGRNSLTDILKYLPVNKDDKLIPIQQLRLECVFFWSNVIRYLRNVEDGEEYLENILPELTPFSNYMERVIREKLSVTMDEWENLEFQNVLFQLFQISSGFDMSDEVGRKTLYALILKILTTNKFQQKVVNKIIEVAFLLNRDFGSLTIDLCQVISEIREPLTDEPPSEDMLRKQNFEITQVRVKIHQLEIDCEEALKKKDFQHAHIVQNEIKECQRKMDDLKNMFEKVRVSKDNPETICRCLDILIGLLRIPSSTVMSPALQSCRDEFLMPLLSNNTSEVHWRFLLCLGLFSSLDEDLAFKHANFLCLPIATYRAIQNYDKIALKTSVAIVTDLICMFGVKVIGMQESVQSDVSQDGNPATSRRKLYSEDFNEPEVLNKDDITIEFIIDIIVDMLDDEDEGVRSTAITSIFKLIAHEFPINSQLICRLILKWYNPETEKQDARLHQKLGSIIECFTKNTKGAKKKVQKAVVPIISSIVNASGTSPLLEIDKENVLRLLAALTSTDNNNDSESVHNEIAADLIERMSNKPNDSCTPYLVKLLTFLEFNFNDPEKCKNLITSAEFLAHDLVDGISQKNLISFRDKLIDGLKRSTTQEKGDNSENQASMNQNTIENLEDRSSLVRQSIVNGESNNENQDQLEDTDISGKVQEHNRKRNTVDQSARIRQSVVNRDSFNNQKNEGSKHNPKGNSKSDSDEDSVTNCSINDEGENHKSTRSGKKLLLKGLTKPFKGKGKLEEISEEHKKSISKNTKAELRRISNESGSVEDDSICVKCDYTTEKNTEIKKKSNETLENTNKIKNANSRNCNIEIISQVVLRNTEKSSDSNELSENSPQSSIKTRSNKTKATTTSAFTSVDLSKRKLRKRNIPSDNGSTSVCAKPNDENHALTKQSERRTSMPSKFNDYVTSSLVERKTTTKSSRRQKQVDKRTAETPLSTTVKRRSKRHSKDPTLGETPRTSNVVTNTVEKPVLTPFEKKNTNTPLSVGKRSSRRFGRTPTTVSKRKKTLPSLTVRKNLRSSLRNCNPLNRKRLPATPNSALRNIPNKISRMKPPPEKKSSTNHEDSPTRLKEGKDEIAKNVGSTSKVETRPNTSKNHNLYNKTHILRRRKMNDNSENGSDDESSEKVEKSKKSFRNQKRDQLVLTNKRKIRKNPEKQGDEVELKQKVKTSQRAKKDENNSNSAGKEKPKDKIAIKKSNSGLSEGMDNGVLKNLNSVMNKMNNISMNRRSSRIRKNTNRSVTKNDHKEKTKELLLQQETPSTLTRSRLSNGLNKTSTGSRRRLDFSSVSDETILKTFLQGDEEISEDISVEDVNSLSNMSGDSKKENLSIHPSTSPSSSRRSDRRKRNRQDSSPGGSESLPRKKMMGTKYKKNLQS